MSLSQGFSMGMRPFAGGGVAALVDVAGNDAYPDGSTFIYTNATGAGQQLYLIVDGYGSSGFGLRSCKSGEDQDQKDRQIPDHRIKTNH